MINAACAVVACWPLAVHPPAPPAVPATPSIPPTATDRSAFESRLLAFDESVASVKGLMARFEQRKHSPLLKRPMVSRGTVKARAGHVRWDTLEPAPSTLTMNETEVRVYYPEAQVVEIYPTVGNARGASVGPLPRLAAIRAQFDIAEIAPSELGTQSGDEPGQYIAIRLTPKTPALREHVKVVRVLLDTRQTLARRIEITDADDEVTDIEFTDVRTGVEIRYEDLQLDVPPETRESRPVAPSGGRVPAGDGK